MREGNTDMPIKKTSPKGRIGRIQFACWGTVFLMLPSFLSAAQPVGIIVLPITFPLYIFAIMKRLRDINTSPWLALIAWIPLLNLPLFFIPGSKADNRFGEPPVKFTSSELTFAIILPLAFTFLMFANIAPGFMETYEYYEMRAESGGNTP